MNDDVAFMDLHRAVEIVHRSYETVGRPLDEFVLFVLVELDDLFEVSCEFDSPLFALSKKPPRVQNNPGGDRAPRLGKTRVEE